MADLNIDNKLTNYIVQTLDKCIYDTKNLIEFSQVLQIDNICKFK